MIVGIIKELPPETRVAFTPAVVQQLAGTNNLGFVVERGAGESSGFSDSEYLGAGAAVMADKKEVLEKCDIVFFVHAFYDGCPLNTHKIMVGPVGTGNHFDHLLVYQNRPVTLYALNMIPRSTLAQSMDILSSMASLAGYKAVIRAADRSLGPLPMFTTAAGTLKPAQLVVLGAGVAGLQAIATARRLGAKVEAYDVRLSAQEEIKSLGAKFIEIPGATENAGAGGYAVEQTEAFREKQKAVLHEHISKADIVISTAQIPGKKAPLLIEQRSVESMRPGSVIVDLAAASGGNCALTQNGRSIVHNGVEIIGDSFLVRSVPASASRLLANNHAAFLKHYIEKQNNETDEILTSTRVFTKGKITHPSFLQQIEI